MSELEKSDEARRAEELIQAEFSLLQHAANYRLSSPDERSRSNEDLTRLFHNLVSVIKPDAFIEVGAFFAETSRRIKKKSSKNARGRFRGEPAQL